MTIGILALQGDFAEHKKRLEELGTSSVELRQRSDITALDGLVLPGGESTVQRKLLQELDMLAPLKKAIQQGLPVLGTCAGLILLAEEVNDGEPAFGTLPVRVRRNAYGRQLGSFAVRQPFKGLGEIEMRFIRGPYIEAAQDDVEILAVTEGKITAVRYQNQLGMAFHPELSSDVRIHQEFLRMVERESFGSSITRAF